jgi:hypothetical protein
MNIGDQIIHPVNGADESALATPRWPNDRRDPILWYLNVNILQRPKISIIKVEICNV